MKNFLKIASIVTVIFLVIVYFKYTSPNAYLFFKTTDSTPVYYFNNNQLYSNSDPHKKIVVKGVEIDSAYANFRGNEFTIKEEKWLDWFEKITELNATVIKVPRIMDAGFYNAFYRFNEKSDQPLYMLHTIKGDHNKDKSGDINSYKNTLDFFVENGRKTIDLIHGNKIMMTNKEQGNGLYFRDISPWVIGYLIGDEWNQGFISYINDTLILDDDYNGKYIKTSEKALNFETMMAEIIDKIIDYESRKYKTQRLISVNSSFIMDPFRYEKSYAAQIEKINIFQMENIQSTPLFQSNLFTSYVYDQEDVRMLDLITKTTKENSNYLEKVRKEHSYPVFISSIGYPSESYLNYQDNQGEVLVSKMKELERTGYNGVFISTWQDVWDRRRVETSFAVDLHHIHRWHDELTPTQHFGLLGFKPLRNGFNMSIDGETNDWKDIDSITNNSAEIKSTIDEAAVYFLIKDPKIKKEETYYLALSTHPEIGSKDNNILPSTFNNKMNYIIEINKEGAKVYVQKRYQAVRQNFLENVTGEDPFIDHPKIDDARFEPVKYLKNKGTLLSPEEFENSKKYIYNFEFQESSKLESNSSSENLYRQDLFVRDGLIELRVPLLLLNINNPFKLSIHDDYYKYFGKEELKIKNFQIEIHSKKEKITNTIELEIKPLSKKIKVIEFLKPSYYKVQKFWSERGK